MLTSAQRNLRITSTGATGNPSVRTLNSTERLEADEEAAAIQERMLLGAPDRQPAWGERSPDGRERSRRLTRPTPAAAYAFRGGMLAPGTGPDAGKSARGLGARAPGSVGRTQGLGRQRSARPATATARSAAAIPGRRNPTSTTRPVSASATTRPESGAGSSSSRASSSGRQRRKPNRDPRESYVRRLEGQVAELRDTLSLLADINTSHVEAAAKTQRRRASKPATSAPATRRTTQGKRGARGARGARIPASKFAARVSDAMAEEASHAAVVARIHSEVRDSEAREAALTSRVNDTHQQHEDGHVDAGEEDSDSKADDEGASGEAAEEQQDDSSSSSAAEAAAATAAATEAETAHDDDEGKEEDNADDLEGWAAEDEAWVHRVRQQYLDTATRAKKWTVGSKGRASSKGRAKARPQSAGAKPRYMQSKAEMEREAEMTISRRRFEEEKARLEEQERALRRYRFRAKPVPKSTRLALYDKVVAQAATRRKLQHEARKAELAASIQPFQNMEVGDRARAQAAARRAAERREAEERELRLSSQFRANPVPPTTRAPDAESQAWAERDAMRAERVALRARQMLEQSRLPPRMALFEEEEAVRVAEREERQRRDEAEERRRNAVRPTPLPDFDGLHQRFEDSLAKSRRGRALTQPEPFSFDSEERKAAEAAKAEQRKREAEDRLAEMTRTTSGLPRHGGDHDSDDEDSPLGAGSRSARLRRLRESVGGSSRSGSGGMAGKLSAGGFKVSMTRAAELRIATRQKELRERQAREEAEALAEEARRQKQRQIDGFVKPVVQALEHARRPEPLAWQLEADTPEAQERRAAEAEEFLAQQSALADRIKAAEESRPMLFTRGSVDSARVAAEREALSRVAASLQAGEESRTTAWRDGTGDDDGEEELGF